MSRSDLTGYTALLGESLSAKVDLLGRLLGNAHYPSVGQYKERLLADAIRGFLPRTVEVGTGFVLFPHADPNPVGGAETYDPLNQSAYSISRQCDILVYDSTRYPVVFRDGDFVVVRPEAVRAVIEVKGSLSRDETLKALSSFHDFGGKWRDTQIFYLEKYVHVTRTPALFIMAWAIQKDKTGRPRTSPSAVREMIAKFYAENVPISDLDGYPLLEQLLIYNEAQVTSTFGANQTGEGVSLGWSSTDGQFVRFAQDGVPKRDKDRTIAALLASLHWAVAEQDFNRFLSYQDEIRDPNVLPYRHAGISWAWPNLNVPDAKRITNRVPDLRKR